MKSEDARKNPFPGPRPFERSHQDRFFGRDREIIELSSLVIAHQVVLLYAQSGAGKTSLLNAALIPTMEDEEYQVLPVVRVRGLETGDENIAVARNVFVYNALAGLYEVLGEDGAQAPGPDTTLSEFLAAIRRQRDEDEFDKPLLLILDQMEEIFTAYPERWEQREPFFHQIRDALGSISGLRVLFVIREDYLAGFDEFRDDLPGELRTRMRMERLRRDQALDALERPLEGTGRGFEAGAADELLDELVKIKVEGSVGEVRGEFVEPVQLQVVCQSLWDSLPQQVTLIRSAELKSFGDVDQALREFYHRALTRTHDETGVGIDSLRDWFEKSLITPADTRGSVFQGQEQTDGIPNAAVKVLADQHIIRGEMRSGSHWFELTHDRFVEPIKQSNLDWWNAHPLKRLLRRDSGRVRSVALWITSAVAVLVLGMALIAFYQAQQAEQREREAKLSEQATRLAFAQKLTADVAKEASVLAETGRLDLGLLLALESRHLGGLIEQRSQALMAAAGDLNISLGQGPVDRETGLLRTLQANPRLLRYYDRGSRDVRVHAIAFSADGRRMALPGRDHTIEIMDAESGAVIRRLTDQSGRSHDNQIGGLAFLAGGERLVSVAWNNVIRLWDVATGGLLAEGVLSGEAGRNGPRSQDLAVGADGQRVYTANKAGWVDVWNAADLTHLNRLSSGEPGAEIEVVRLGGPRKEFVVAAGCRTPAQGGRCVQGAVWSWTAATAKRLKLEWQGETPEPYREAGKFNALAIGGSDLAVGGDDKNLIIMKWSWPTQPDAPARIGLVAVVENAHEDRILDAAYNADGSRLITTSRDSRVAVRDPATGERLGEALRGHGDWVWSVRPHPRKAHRLLTGSGDGVVIAWDESRRFRLGESLPSEDGDDRSVCGSEGKRQVWSLAFAGGTSQRLAAGDSRGCVRVWDTHRTAPPVVSIGNRDVAGIPSLVYTQQGQVLMGADRRGSVRSWRGDTGVEIEERRALPNGEAFSIAALDVSQDGSALLFGVRGGGVYWVDLRRDGWQPQKVMDGFTGWGDSLAFQPGSGGRFFAAASAIREVDGPNRYSVALRRRDASGQWKSAGDLHDAQGHNGPVFSVAFSPDGKALASGGDDNTLSVWDVAAAKRLLPPVKAHNNRINSVRFSDDGRWLFSASRDSTVKMWDARSGRAISVFNGHDNWLDMVKFDAVSGLLASAGDDGKVIVWDLDPRRWEQRACVIANRKLADAERATYLAEVDYYLGNPPHFRCEIP